MATAIGIIQKPNQQSSQASWVDESNPAMAALLGLAVDETQAQGAYVYSFDPLAATASLVSWAGLPVSEEQLAIGVSGDAAKAHFGRADLASIIWQCAVARIRQKPLPARNQANQSRAPSPKPESAESEPRLGRMAP